MREEHMNPEDLERPEEIIDEMVDELKRIRKALSEKATDAGQEIDRLEALRPYWKELAEANTDDSNVYRVYASGVRYLGSVRDEIKYTGSLVDGATHDLDSVFRGVQGTAVTTNSTTSFVSIKIPALDEAFIAPQNDRFLEIRNSLSNQDPELGNLYAGAREIFYGTEHSPERGALFLMRQLFDHLFSILAPDNRVRETVRPDQQDDTEEITRRERIIYAANTHVQNAAKRETLIAGASHFLDVYTALNSAHKRGILDPAKTRAALKEIYTLVGDWALAIAK